MQHNLIRCFIPSAKTVIHAYQGIGVGRVWKFHVPRVVLHTKIVEDDKQNIHGVFRCRCRWRGRREIVLHHHTRLSDVPRMKNAIGRCQYYRRYQKLCRCEIIGLVQLRIFGGTEKDCFSIVFMLQQQRGFFL